MLDIQLEKLKLIIQKIEQEILEIKDLLRCRLRVTIVRSQDISKVIQLRTFLFRWPPLDSDKYINMHKVIREC